MGLVRTRTRGDGNGPAKGEKVSEKEKEKAHTGISGFFHKALHHKDHDAEGEREKA